MKLIVNGFKKLLKGELSKRGKLKLLIRCTRPKSIAIFIFGSWLFFGGIALLFALSLDELETVGQFGDFFGTLNTLFSGAALAGVIVSIMMQRKELHLQRREMQLTRKEMQDQRVVMDEQKNTLQEQHKVWEKQNFDTFFFSLYRSHLEVKNSLEYIDSSETVHHGINVFNYFSTHLRLRCDELAEPEKICAQIKLDMLNKFPFEAYASSLSQLFLTVDNAPKGINKNRYRRLILSSISLHEEFPLFFFGTYGKFEYLKSQLEHYTMLPTLKNFEPYDITSFACYHEYKETAFTFSEAG